MTVNESISSELSRTYFLKEVELFQKNYDKPLNYKLLNESYEENRQIGENETYICSLIRTDSVEEFITYVNQTNLKISTATIKPSIFETNQFLLGKKNITLIEYAAFFGSIQIFQYLQMNKIKLTQSLWLFAIHGRNPELIHRLEDNKIIPKDSSYFECFKEAIKCHHNEIAVYIKDNLLTNKKIDKNFSLFVLQNCNYSFLPDDILDIKFGFFILCQYQLYKIAQLYLENKNIQPIPIINIGDDFIITKTIENSFLVKQNSTNKFYLLKFKKKYIDVQILLNYRMPGLLNIKGYCPIDYYHHDCNMALFDYYPNTLIKYLEDKKNDQLCTYDYILILGIAIIFKNLHSKNIIHYKLNPSMILIDENYYPIVYGIEESLDAKQNQYTLKQYVLNQFSIYESPEAFKDFTYFLSSNVFSYSLIVYLILTRKIPFEISKSYDGYLSHLKILYSGGRPDVSMIKSEFIVDFLKKCWKTNQSERLKFNDIVDMILNSEFYSYFHEINHESVKKYLAIFKDDLSMPNKKCD